MTSEFTYAKLIEIAKQFPPIEPLPTLIETCACGVKPGGEGKFYRVRQKSFIDGHKLPDVIVAVCAKCDKWATEQAARRKYKFR